MDLLCFMVQCTGQQGLLVVGQSLFVQHHQIDVCLFSPVTTDTGTKQEYLGWSHSFLELAGQRQGELVIHNTAALRCFHLFPDIVGGTMSRSVGKGRG